MLNRKVIVSSLSIIGFVLCVFLITRSGSIPPHVQVQASFSRAQAKVLYANAKREMWLTYWRGLLGDLKGRQFRYGWKQLVKGPGAIEGLVTGANSNVMAYIKCGSDDGFWITVQDRLHVTNPVLANKGR